MLEERRHVKAKTRALVKAIEQLEAWIVRLEKRYSTNAMLSKLQQIGNRVEYFANHSRMKDITSMMIRLGQLEASMKTVQAFTQEEVGVLRRLIVASIREPYDVRARLNP